MMSPGVKTPHGLKTQDSQQHMSVWEAGGVNSVFFFFFFAVPCGTWALSSSTWGQLCTPVVEVHSLTCWTARELLL